MWLVVLNWVEPILSISIIRDAAQETDFLRKPVSPMFRSRKSQIILVIVATTSSIPRLTHKGKKKKKEEEENLEFGQFSYIY